MTDSPDPQEAAGASEQEASTTARARTGERQATRLARKQERERRRANRPRMKKLRFLAVLSGLAALAAVSWVFGVIMAVAQDLPDLEAAAQFDSAENTVVYASEAGSGDEEPARLATLTGNEQRILVDSAEISPLMEQAVVAIEDERFYEHRGIDYLALARALREDVLAGGAVQGGSTITQQFVKNALEAQDDRTILQKLKESALAYQIERQWSKDKILTNYLNNIYFGEGAYGIEAAAKTYFGENHPGCGEEGDRCAGQLRVEEAAMLAGMISSPRAYSPKADPAAAVARRNVVLDKMRELGMLEVSDSELADLKAISAPGATTIEPPKEDSLAPYFTDWLRQQVVDRYGAGVAFGGGLEITTTLDLELQQTAQEIVSSRMDGLGPTAAVVAIENGTGAVRAMVGGSDFEESPFNLATNGRRQPGSAFKPFTLLAALTNGKSAEDTYASKPIEIPFENRVKNKNGKVKVIDELFKVSNYEDNYLGTASIRAATTYSDNSVYAQLGTEIGVDEVVETAKSMGIESRLGDNPALILGGMKRGVTPLEMAYAYSTLANRGEQVTGSLASQGVDDGPVAIEQIERNGKPLEDQLGADGKNETSTERVLDEGVANEAIELLRTVVTSGTGSRAQVGDAYVWGKTGTTDNNADAWFVGSTDQITIAVWVGHPDGAIPMETEFGGAPVDGGTIPTLIFNEVLAAFLELDAGRAAAEAGDEEVTTTTPAPAPAVPVEPAPAPEPVPEPEESQQQKPPPEPGSGGGEEAGPGSGGGADLGDGGGAIPDS